MRRHPLLFTGFVTFLLILPGSSSSKQNNVTDRLLIDTFDLCLDAKTRLPCGWDATKPDVSMYSLEQEKGNYFVKIRSRHGYTAIGKRVYSRGAGMRFLLWRWRAHVLPEGARENDKKKADSGAGVYVIFRGHFWMNNIVKYVWSTTLPPGTVTQSPYSSRTKIIVVRSGAEKLGSWIAEKVNVHDDYRRLYSAEPPEIVAIGIMSDADNTRSYAEADYDGFFLEN
ncbi:MAG: DUF3047 domain-containing protein [Chitinispirillaceae bacterium]|nr:DUF3047 domain-containing protein [Chitinispirillaceae bacterium]